MTEQGCFYVGYRLTDGPAVVFELAIPITDRPCGKSPGPEFCSCDMYHVDLIIGLSTVSTASHRYAHVSQVYAALSYGHRRSYGHTGQQLRVRRANNVKRTGSVGAFAGSVDGGGAPPVP